MDKDTFALNNQTYSNNNILLGIINELQQIANSSQENLTIKRISDVIIKMNFIMNQFIKLEEQIQQFSKKFDVNNINNQQELKGIKNGHNWRYVGQVVNGLREGKGIGKMVIDMKEIIETIIKMEKVFIILVMEIDMKVILEMIKLMEKEFIIGIMVIYIKEILEMVKKKEKEFIIIIMVIYMKEILEMIYQKEKEFIIIIMVIYMKVILKIGKVKEKEFFIIIMVIDQWVIIIMINQ